MRTLCSVVHCTLCEHHAYYQHRFGHATNLINQKVVKKCKQGTVFIAWKARKLCSESRMHRRKLDKRPLWPFMPSHCMILILRLISLCGTFIGALSVGNPPSARVGLGLTSTPDGMIYLYGGNDKTGEFLDADLSLTRPNTCL